MKGFLYDMSLRYYFTTLNEHIRWSCIKQLPINALIRRWFYVSLTQREIIKFYFVGESTVTQEKHNHFLMDRTLVQPQKEKHTQENNFNTIYSAQVTIPASYFIGDAIQTKAIEYNFLM